MSTSLSDEALRSSNVVDEACAEMDDWRTVGAGKPNGPELIDVHSQNHLDLQATTIQEMRKGSGMTTVVSICRGGRRWLAASRGAC
jgi:hypothetical protein